ncbi:MAG: LysM peptidoglycan-binding domain-containing protein, partial [Treponema sp.]|nr:LysM peptidoglycan-binding domain-containing protein [Treponema sp.]
MRCPRNARELTEEEMILVNGGSKKKEEPKTDTHTVVSGDTLSQIVYDYNKENGTNLTVNEVAKNSGISDPDKIYPGQTINLGPSGGASGPGSGSGSGGSGNGSGSGGSGGNSGSPGNTPSSPSSANNTNSTTSNTVKGPERHSAYDQQYINEMMENDRKNALGNNGIQGTAVTGNKIEGKEFSTNANLYNPSSPDPDKRYNGQNYYNNETGKIEHLMIVSSTDKYNYRNIRDYYLTVGQYGSAGTIKYDGIGITNSKGEIIEIQKDEKSIAEYSQKIGMPVGTFMDTVSAVGDFAGNASTATGVAAFLTESKLLGDVSSRLGILSGGIDFLEAINDPTFSNWYDVATDAAYFIPGVGIYVGGGMTVGK